jgi:hypothetical protein
MKLLNISSQVLSVKIGYSDMIIWNLHKPLTVSLSLAEFQELNPSFKKDKHFVVVEEGTDTNEIGIEPIELPAEIDVERQMPVSPEIPDEVDYVHDQETVNSFVQLLKAEEGNLLTKEEWESFFEKQTNHDLETLLKLNNIMKTSANKPDLIQELLEWVKTNNLMRGVQYE